jgi:hypothetical protein
MQRYNPKVLKQVKTAIKELAELKGISPNSYHKLSNIEVFEYMLDNGMGVQWITLERVRRRRRELPKMYQEK